MKESDLYGLSTLETIAWVLIEIVISIGFPVLMMVGSYYLLTKYF